VVLTVLSAPATTYAFEKAACVASHEAAQKSMKAGLSQESKAQLLVCADSSCPALVREDCEKWLSNLDRQPRPVIEKADEQASEKGSEEGSEKGKSKSGPGSSANDAIIPTTQATNDREQRDRSNAAAPDERRSQGAEGNGSPETAETASTQRPIPPAVDAQSGPNRQGGHERSSPGDDLIRVAAARPRPPVPAAAWVTGGLALASFGTAASFGVTGWLDARSLRESCAPNCAASRVSSVRQNLLMADLSALAGVAFSAATAWMIWSHGGAESPERSKPDAARLSASMTGHSFRLDYAASF
jgi:hypothetical protein